MKTNNFKAILLTGALALGMGACKKDFAPSTAIDENSALTNAADIETATIGVYALVRHGNYTLSGHFLKEFPSDEVAQGQISSNDYTNTYRYTHLTTGTHSRLFWTQAYLVVSAANKIIAAIPEDASAAQRQLKGENLFLRAMMHFDLVRVFGRPYTQNNGDNPGVPILKEDLTDEQKLTISRSKVSEVYAFVIEDLLKAADMMTLKKLVFASSFASKQAANALLARVYLYMGDNNNALEFANKVINSGDYSLVQGGAYTNYFRTVADGNKETIFAIHHTKLQDQVLASIGAFYYSGDASGTALAKGTNGWGEVMVSRKYWLALDSTSNDLRLGFIRPYRVNGVLQYNPALSPQVPLYYHIKYSLQEGIITLSSPVYLRIAEMYLIRAEANAKLGSSQLALDNVNLIRQRAALTGAKLHTLASIALSGKSALDVVLEERWFELAFEGHRAYDLFRNGRSMVRNYPGTHQLNVTPVNINQTVLATDNRVIFFIPETERAKNPNLTQNP